MRTPEQDKAADKEELAPRGYRDGWNDAKEGLVEDVEYWRAYLAAVDHWAER